MEQRTIARTGELGKPAQASAPRRPAAEWSPAHNLDLLQRSIGNRALGTLLQAKLAVGPAGGEYEQEADRVADHVMRMPAPMTGNASTDVLQRKNREDDEEQGTPERLARKPALGAGAQSGAAAPQIVHDVLSSPGRQLDPAARSFFEPRFGRDLGQVRVHTGARAEESASAVNALAYTVGNNLVFASGQYAPGSAEGRRLLAHELTHVMQQSGPAASSHIPATPQLVQRFESEEHQHLGDLAAPGQVYNLGTTDKFELTHGDIVALSGDVFPPDELFRLAAIPGNNGQKVGTRDEILWALQDPRIWELRAAATGPYAGKTDPRFQAGGPYEKYVFSVAVRDTVFQRYRKLGADNAGHFVAPQGRDPSGAPLPAAVTAGGTYRTLHELAIKQADKAGRANGDIGMAMAQEAAGQHFLSDEFSAGHLRTPIAAIREYWRNKYPLFWYNLRRKIALDTAINMWVPTGAAFDTVLTTVEALAPTLPAVTLGDLLGSVYHDVDNERGLSTAAGGKVFGDSHLDAATEKLAVAAMQSGITDIRNAYDIGKQSGTAPIADADLFGQVRLRGGGTADKYQAEMQIPEPGQAEPSQNWKAPDFNTLWDQKLLGTSGDTVGQEISRRVTGGSIAIQLNSLAEQFPVDGAYNTHPRASYLAGFVRPLQANPRAGVLDVINWVPHNMKEKGNAEAARNTIADLERRGTAGDTIDNLANLTFEQRAGYVNVLIANKSDFDKNTIITIFSNTTVPERPELYKRIEGHDWTGDLQHGKANDRLYEMMKDNSTLRDSLKDRINGK